MSSTAVARRARSPPPPCRPSRRGAGRATSGRSSGRTSARPSRTRRARARALSRSSTVSKPKWVSLIWHQPAVNANGRRRSRQRGRLRHRRVAARAGRGQALLVLLPQLVLLRAEEVEVVPGEDAGVVAVGEASAAPRSCRSARAPSARPRACRSAAPPAPGRGPAPRPTASRRASARTGCGKVLPSPKPTSSTRDLPCTVMAVGCGVFEVRPAMGGSSKAREV